MPQPASRAPKVVAARAVSIVGHPMLLVPVAIALALRGHVDAGQGAAILGVVAGAIVLVGAYLIHGVRSGRLSHIDVSKREERGGFYRVSTIALAIATAALHLSHATTAAVRGTAVALALIVVSSIVNRWIKASLHTAFAIVAAGVVGVGTKNAPLFALFVVAAAAVAWSRLVLGRHTKPEIVVGAILGTLAAVVSALVT